jgi:uncharacterized protein with HEPN domain
MSEKDYGNLLAIIDASEKTLKYTSQLLDADMFYLDEKTFDAVLMNFVIIGESVARLSAETLTDNDSIPWAQIKGFRNMVAHDYFGVDAEEVWEIIQNHIPKLILEVKNIIEKMKNQKP